jgi:SAM-dependent methyltransferase
MTEVMHSAAAFDGLAQRYDAQFTTTALGSVLRQMTWRRFERAFEDRGYLLDIGCGTGEDALHLASLGHRVLATDASLQMVRMATSKAEKAGCAHRIRFLWVPMEKLHTELAGEKFDGVYSNFGAINCAADPRGLAASLAGLLVPGAPLCWVVMGRYVPWEWAWYLARADVRTAFRRLRRDGTEWRGLALTYPTPAALGRMIAAHFDMVEAVPMGVALPGSYAVELLERRPRMLGLLARLERRLQKLPGLAACGDHYYFEARRRAA